MRLLLGVLLNIGSNSTSPNGRGRIFEDYSFEYLPIPEEKTTRQHVPTYGELGFGRVKHPNLPVHLDPRFDTYTYGHVRRGFGDIKRLLELNTNDVLFFHATLQRENEWSTYIIGYFRKAKVYDCRRLAKSEIHNFHCRGFADNAHLKRSDPSVDLFVKGGSGSKRLLKAFPLAEEVNTRALRKPLRSIIRTVTGKEIKPGSPWFRWTLTCKEPALLLRMIAHHGHNCAHVLPHA